MSTTYGMDKVFVRQGGEVEQNKTKRLRWMAEYPVRQRVAMDV